MSSPCGLREGRRGTLLCVVLSGAIRSLDTRLLLLPLVSTVERLLCEGLVPKAQWVTHSMHTLSQVPCWPLSSPGVSLIQSYAGADTVTSFCIQKAPEGMTARGSAELTILERITEVF
jgi:hypothetical protein